MKWHELVAKIGVPTLHLHDLRHTGNTLAASSGASLKDLMTRMGHDSPAAALIYQHATREADAAIAIAMNDRLSVYLKPEAGPEMCRCGPCVAQGALKGPQRYGSRRLNCRIALCCNILRVWSG